jgi:hypothetical protein
LIKKPSNQATAYGKLKRIFSIGVTMPSSTKHPEKQVETPLSELHDFSNLLVYPQMGVEGSKINMANFLPTFYAPLQGKSLDTTLSKEDLTPKKSRWTKRKKSTGN